jgi:hypothetical protein
MHSFVTILAVVAGLAGIGSAGQVNFYSDSSCQSYIGSRTVGAFQISGYVAT